MLHRHGKREYLAIDTTSYWTLLPCPSRPISLDTLVNAGLVLNVDGKPYPCGDWMADAWRRLADADDQADTLADALGTAVQ